MRGPCGRCLLSRLLLLSPKTHDKLNPDLLLPRQRLGQATGRGFATLIRRRRRHDEFAVNRINVIRGSVIGALLSPPSPGKKKKHMLSSHS